MQELLWVPTWKDTLPNAAHLILTVMLVLHYTYPNLLYSAHNMLYATSCNLVTCDILCDLVHFEVLNFSEHKARTHIS